FPESSARGPSSADRNAIALTPHSGKAPRLRILLRPPQTCCPLPSQLSLAVVVLSAVAGARDSAVHTLHRPSECPRAQPPCPRCGPCISRHAGPVRLRASSANAPPD